MAKLALLICLASTLFMTGVIWFVQVVHYPLFDRVKTEAFRRYHADHSRLTTYVVMVPMTLELLSSLALVVQRPSGSSRELTLLGFGLALSTWVITFLKSVPAHERLGHGFDSSIHRQLVRSNVARVVAWTAHSVVVLVMTARTMD